MPVEIRVPQMGESVTEATILRWLKKEGETVAAGDPVAELETDKVNVEVPADSAGVIQSFAHAEGDTVAVGDVLAIVGDAVGVAAPPAHPNKTPNAGGAEVEAAPPPLARNGDGAPAPAASPLARTLAEDNKIDLSLVKGTGPVGRIVKDDVANYLERSNDAPAVANVLAAEAVKPQVPPPIPMPRLPRPLPHPAVALKSASA